MRQSLVLTLAVVTAACASREAPPGTLEELTLTSTFTGETYDLEIFTPDALDEEVGATVVYIFDGPENQPRVLDQFRQALDEGAEPAILALIPGSNRVEDFTPTPNERGTNGGGQAEFVDFVIEEFAPLVEENGAGGEPSRRITFGHSLGGLLSGTFWYDEPFATRAGIASPSFWWDGGLYFSKLAEPPVNAGPIVVACGEEEPFGMVVYTDDFSRQMRNDYDVEVTYEAFKNKNHQSALESALGLTFRELL
ncbi:MAG: alpha/beta hydrolase-fold protein [Myxococcota bacterium]